MSPAEKTVSLTTPPHDSAIAAYWQWEVIGQKMECSDQLCTILGRLPEEMASITCIDDFIACFATDGQQQISVGFQACLEQNMHFSGNFPITKKAGDIVTVCIQATPFIRDGVTVRIIGTVTERTNPVLPGPAEEEIILKSVRDKELLERDQLFRLISDNATDLLWAYDLQTGKYTYSSPSVTRLCGRTQEEMLTLGLFDVLTPEAAQKAAAELHYRIQAIEAGDESAIQSGVYAFDELRKDGSVYQTEVMVALVRNESGQVTGVVGITRDVTERLRNERKKQDFEKNIYESQKRESIGRIASGIAHELNSTLTPLIGYTEYLMDMMLNSDEERTLLDEVYASVMKARDLVSQLVDFSLQQHLSFKPLDINSEINSCEHLLRGFLRNSIGIRFRLSGNLPLIKGDSGKIRQVIMNLAANAQDAMPDGGTLTIETRLAEHDDFQAGANGMTPGTHVEIIVSDTGTGITQDIIPLIFEPFFTTKQTGAASGLGLSSVSGVIGQHQGTINVASRIGEGSSFTISLPVPEEKHYRAQSSTSNKAIRITEWRAPSAPGTDGKNAKNEKRKPALAGEMKQDMQVRENLLRSALEAERQSKELQHRFLTMISHEYRTPLSIISANLEILELQEADHHYGNELELGKMKRAVHRLVEVMEISLERGRLFDPRTKAEFMRFEISPLLALQLDDIRVIWPERLFTYTDGMVGHMVFGDTQYLKTAFFNLLDNAQKYSSHNSPIDIETCIEGSEAIIRICNQGHTLSKKESEQVFEKYSRGTTSTNTSGAGIGLWLVREIIEQHGGTVTLESTSNGIEATVRLPLADYGDDS